MDIIEAIQNNFLDIVGQIIAGLVVVFIAGIFTLIRKVISRDTSKPFDKRALLEEFVQHVKPPNVLQIEIDNPPNKEPIRWKWLAKFLAIYLISCIIISIVAFMGAGAVIEGNVVMSGTFISDISQTLAFPVLLIALTVAFIIYTSEIKEVATIATIVVIVVCIIELTRGDGISALIGAFYSVFHIGLSITIGPCVGICIKKIRNNTVGYSTSILIGGAVSAAAYSLLLLTRAYLFL